jgi:hypothetical protein
LLVELNDYLPDGFVGASLDDGATLGELAERMIET